MSREDVEEYIREQAEQPTEITADDLEPPECVWCGDVIGQSGDAVVWDIPIQGDGELVERYLYCSESCKDSDREAAMLGEEMHPHGQSETLTPEEREAKR
jgi:hypothetical protein